MLINRWQLNYQGRLVFERAIYEAPVKGVRPMVDEACFLYVTQGEWQVYSPQGKQAVKVNESVVMKCGSYLNECLKTIGSTTCEAVAVHLYPELLRSLFDEDLSAHVGTTALPKRPPLKEVARHTLVDKYIESMLFYFENPTLVDDTLVRLKLKELIHLLLKTDQGATIQSLYADLFSPQSFTLKQVVEEYLYADISLEQLAVLAGLSLSSFKRKFKELYQDTPANYIRTQKLSRAAHLLQSTTLPISDIAYECGFNHPNYFSQVFLKAYRQTPSAFRMA